MNDDRYMQQALRLAARGLGTTAPNPAVGCVLVANGQVVGRGHTQPGGRPHAETVALAQAGEAARGATAYVTLEPCAHEGETGPCADALIAAGITRVVMATRDVDPRTAGQGIARLKAAGIDVTEGLGEVEAKALNLGFFRRIEAGVPMVGVKVASSADGMMATAAGQSQWITGPAARAEAHALRATHDAVLTGIGTVLADDPLLTVRIAGREDTSPIRIVLDRSLRLPAKSRLAQTAREVPLLVLTGSGAPEGRKAALEAEGAEVIRLPDIGIQPENVLKLLGGRGLTRLLVEAGPSLSTAFLQHADRLYWFRAPIVIGKGGMAAFDPQSGALSELQRWKLTRSRQLDVDRLEVYSR